MQKQFPAERYPLSMNQRNIWDVERVCPDSPINAICTTLKISGRVHFPLLKQSVEAVLQADATLRTQLTLQDQTPVQYIADFAPPPIPIYDFTQTDADGIENWQIAFTREPLPLLDAPLFRFAILHTGHSGCCLVVKLHHLISDGWTQVLLCNRIGQCYLDLLAGKEPELGEIPSYLSHIEASERYLASAQYQKDEAYWKNRLSQSGEASTLKNVRGAAVSPVGQRLTFALPQDLNNDIYAFCMRSRVAPFSVFYLALAVYFRRVCAADRLTLGVPIFNRKDYAAKQTSGMFVSTLPFSSDLSGDWSANEFIERLNEDWFEMLRHQRYPFEHIRRLAASEAQDAGALFHIAFSYQNAQLMETGDASVSFSGRWHYSGYQLEQLCIHLSNLEDNKRYSVDYDYQTQLFSEQEIATLHHCLVNILREALRNPDRPLSRLAILSPEDRERVLYTFNHSAQPIYDTGLYERFMGHVRRYPGRAALIWNGERTAYAQLEELSARVHAAIFGLCAQPDALVAILLPRTPALFGAMMGVMRAGGAFLLLSPALPKQRLRDILNRSGACALLTDSQTGSDFSDILPVIDTNVLPSPMRQPAAEYRADALAYVVYTSGSTGEPKGVEIENRSLLNLSCAMEPLYGKGAVLSLCSLGFDAFLLESACALLNGRTIVLPHDAEIESPASLAALIRGYGVGFLSATPSRIAAFLKNESFRTALSGMESIICGGEAFPGDLLERLQLYTPARIYNQYGPSETAVAVSVKQLNGASAITAGKPMANCRLYILDHWKNPLPVGVYGDLYVGGLCVGRGYRGAPEMTEESFTESPFILDERLYRTGDIARWTADGEIVLAGRSDHQVKLRGLRIEPEEIAACLARHPGVRSAVAAVQQHSGQDVLLAFYTADTDIPEEKLLSLCAEYLPHYMIPSAVIRLDTLPLTANGKINESLLPCPDLSTSSRQQAETALQDQLLTIFRRSLGRPDLGVDSDYFLFGGNSLSAMEVLGEIADQCGFTVKMADLYVCRSVKRLAAQLEGSPSEAAPAARLTAAPKQERWPLTPIQQGIYVQSHLDPTGKTYHMAGAFRLETAPDIARLQQAFIRLMEQEPLLRTAFMTEPDGIFARVQPKADFVLSVYHGKTLAEAAAPLLEPFRLDEAPLLRAGLWQDEQGRWVLLINLHHIIGDGLTTPVLLSRLDRLYAGADVPAPKLTFLDYAWRLMNQKDDPGQLNYWQERLSPLPEPAELPADFARSRSFDFSGGQVSYALSEKLSADCEQFCLARGLSPYVFFLGAFGVLLSRLTGRDDLIVGAAAAGRLLPETRDMCGPFINTLPLRLRPGRELSVGDYLNAVRDEVNGMLDHQQVGLEEIVSALGLKRQLSQSPLYQVIFSQRPLDAEGLPFDGGTLEYLPLHTGTARMELWTELSRENGRFVFHTEYAAQLFLGQTVAYWSRCLETVVSSMLRSETAPLDRLDALSAVDRMTLLDTPNNTVQPFLNLPVPAQFARWLAMDPDAPAVIFHGQTTTRAQLDRRACQIAHLLSEAGAEPGQRIGIALSRNADLVAAVLAIWKAGCAYAPLLAHYPEQRLSYMVEIAGISHILCDEKTQPQLPDTLPCKQVPLRADGPDTFNAVPLRPADLAEVLFTSGSTGQPKGVMLRWRSIANMAAGFGEILSRSDGPILCTTNVVFDMFNGEAVIPLTLGKTIVMADEEEMMLPWKLAEIIERDGVRITQSTPSRVQMWFSNEAFCRASKQLELMIYGGEVLTETLLRTAQTESDGAKQVNMYGPTEGTVYNTTRPADYREYTNIGWPMRNNRVYVLDAELKPVLPTAVGDIYLAGECVTEGYISRPDLTEKAYLPDPFFPGERMYRTGDLGRLRLDGSYDFHGRRDVQVKLNGQRVELDEISGAMVSEGCALQAAVVPVRHADGSMELLAYYIPTCEQLPESEIRARLSRILPAYMIPSRLMIIDSMPRTPTGKIDLRTLGEMAVSGEAPVCEAAPVCQTPSEPAANAEAGSLDWILSVWKQVLGHGDIIPDRSFFEQGGTSLGALSVLSHYNNSGLSLSLADFYAVPTAQAQADRFRPQANAPAPRPAPQPVHYPARVPALCAAAKAAPGPVGTALLTGATGFLGAHMLRTLLENGADKVICAVRGGDRERLMQTIAWYFGGGWAAGVEHRIEVIGADLSKPALGLDDAAYDALAERIHEIWHCAADVRHYAADSDALMRVNLDGTKTLIALAGVSGAALYHMSTTSVSGSHLTQSGDEAVFNELDFHIGQNWQDNLYVRSKFLAEAAVFDAIRNGLNARVFRLGRLVGRALDGAFQKNPQSNAFWLTLRGIHALGALPSSMAQSPMELTPIDWCAQAVFALRGAPLAVYHIQSPEPPTAEECARAVCERLSVIPDERFDELLRSQPTDQSVLAPLMELWNRSKADRTTVTVDATLTMAQLERCGFRLDIPGPQQLLRGFRFPTDERRKD